MSSSPWGSPPAETPHPQVVLTGSYPFWFAGLPYPFIPTLSMGIHNPPPVGISPSSPRDHPESD
jgi:hypothetical protein